jgi:small subunit ribosomal protein S1
MRPARDPQSQIRRRRPAEVLPEAAPEAQATAIIEVTPTVVEPAPAPARPTEPSRPATDFAGLREIADMSATEIREALSSFTRQTPTNRLRRGQRVSGKITRLTASTAFIEVGAKSDAILERVELDSDARVGDVVEAFVSSSPFDGEIRLTRTPSGDAAADMLEEARRHKSLLSGKVVSLNEHGFEISLGGNLRGFCPSSQIDIPPVTEPERYLNQTLPFRVMEVKGRDAIVTHRSVAEELAAAAAVRELESIREGDVFEGVVTKVRDFGAFVKLPNGVEGLVHLSNLSKTKVTNIQEAIKEGQSVKVKVLSVDPVQRRLSLGIKQAEREQGVIHDTRNAELRQGDGVGFNALASALSGWKKK